MGSVKANIGHLNTASGIAGLIKAVLAVREGVLPPQPNFATPNPEAHLDETPFRVLREAEAWPAPAADRVARVNSFGFGGTNAHLVLQGASPPAPRRGEPNRFP